MYNALLDLMDIVHTREELSIIQDWMYENALRIGVTEWNKLVASYNALFWILD